METISHQSSLTIIIMNANGPRVKFSSDVETGTAEKRRKIILDVIRQESPHLMLFQEFRWKGITGKTWEKSPIPDKYQYTGNHEGSIMYDTNELIITDFTGIELMSALDELKRKVLFKSDFNPLSRMCIRRVQTKSIPLVHFICVSWHGNYNKKKTGEKKNEFVDLQVYLIELLKRTRSEDNDIQLIVGGDFNISVTDINDLVKDELELRKCTNCKRTNVIDFFLISRYIEVQNIRVVGLVEVGEPDSVFDHEPIAANIVVIPNVPTLRGSEPGTNSNKPSRPKDSRPKTSPIDTHYPAEGKSKRKPKQSFNPESTEPETSSNTPYLPKDSRPYPAEGKPKRKPKQSFNPESTEPGSCSNRPSLPKDSRYKTSPIDTPYPAEGKPKRRPKKSLTPESSEPGSCSNKPSLPKDIRTKTSPIDTPYPAEGKPKRKPKQSFNPESTEPQTSSNTPYLPKDSRSKTSPIDTPYPAEGKPKRRQKKSLTPESSEPGSCSNKPSLPKDSRPKTSPIDTPYPAASNPKRRQKKSPIPKGSENGNIKPK